LQRRTDGILSQGEIQRLGLLDYKAEFGSEVTARHWRRWLKTIERRARGENDFSRIDIYLDEDAAPAKVEDSPNPRAEFRLLRGLIDGFLKAGNPTAAQRRQIFDDAFLVIERIGETAKPELLEFLCASAPFLAKNAKALRRNFDLLRKRWLAHAQSIASLDDGRHGRPRGPVLTEAEKIALIAYSAKYGGGRDQGWREAIRVKKLRDEIVNYYSQSLRHMPRKIREQITRKVDDVKMRMHGPRHAVLQGPHINRDPNHPLNPLHSGDWDQSDDYTFVNIMWDLLPDGALYVGQPQLLLWVDERSWLPLGFELIRDSHYNSFDIRNSWTKKCDDHGLPRKGLYLEGGFWQTARNLVGKKDDNEWSQTEMGIRRLGMRIEHAIYPRSKIIERVFRKIQNYLQAEPGYVGTNPITDRYEEIQKQIRIVKSGQADPREFNWLSKAEWKIRFGEILQIYSNEPGEGKYLRGLSPKQAYREHFSTPLAKIPEECRYLLACNKIEGKEIEIRGDGLTVRGFTYKDERLGKMRLENKKAIVWFNVENPEYCNVTDSDGENPIVVKRETSLPGHDAPAELLAKAKAENALFEREPRAVFGACKHVWDSDFEKRRFRPVITDGQSVENESEFKRQVGDRTAGAVEKKAAILKARKSGVNLSNDDPDLIRRAEGIEKMRKAGIDIWATPAA
jgi:hypothetical protein